MAILDFFRRKPSTRQILTSRPIFQSSSSFLKDDHDDSHDYDDLGKPAPKIPSIHNRAKDDLESSTILPKPQIRLRFILHILNTAFTFISLTLFVTTIPIWNANFQHTRSIVSGDYTDGLVVAPLLLSLFVSTYTIITEHTKLTLRFRANLFSSAGTKSKPGTPLSSPRLALIATTILLILGPTLILSATNSLALTWRTPTRTKSGLVICNLSNIFSQECQPILYQVGGLQIGGIAAGAVAWITWLILLLVALRSWARERNEKKMAAARERRRRRHERRARNAGQGETEGERVHRHRRKHERKHGHGHSHSHSHSHESESRHARRHHHKTRRAEDAGSSGSSEQKSGFYMGDTKADGGTVGAQQVQQELQYPDRAFASPAVSRTSQPADNLWPAGLRVGSPAARLASHAVRPKQTIQVWLNDKYVSSNSEKV